MSAAHELPHGKYSLIVDDIAGQIRSGRLKTGDQIAGTAELTAKYGVAVPTIRNAMALLKALGLVETVPGIGTFVK